MRIKVRHATQFQYETPAQSSLQLLRMTPRSHDGQFTRRWRVAIDSDARLDKSEDAYGNRTHLVFVEGPVEKFEIVVEGEVETMESHGILRGTRERQPARLFLRETLLTRPSPAIRRFAREASASQGGAALDTLHRLNSQIHREIEFSPETTDTTDTSTTASQAFDKKRGNLTDGAHILIAAARALNIPTRYVSGFALPTEADAKAAAYGWVEASVPGLGWVAFDPTTGESTTERYVRIAIGCDAREAAPVRGASTGGTEQSIDVSVTVSEVTSFARPEARMPIKMRPAPAPPSQSQSQS